MTLTKSLLLGSAATLVAVAGAQAADLPSKKAAPATYVKVCDAYGAGFFFIPGTDTCVQVGGYVRIEFDARRDSGSTGSADTFDKASFYGRGAMSLDARTPTALGTARTFMRLRMHNGSGTQAVTKGENESLEAAFIQWAGFTFGQAAQPFNMMSSWGYVSNWWTGWPNGVRQLSYQHNLGGGLSAWVSVQDASDQFGAAKTDVTPGIKWSENGPLYAAGLNLRQSWGAVQVMGAYTGDANQLKNNAGTAPHDGWAVGAALHLNLPMLAAGDKLEMQAVYWDRLAKLGMGNTSILTPSSGSWGDNPINMTTAQADALQSSGWNIGAQLVHYWAKSWRSQFYASYFDADANSSAGGAGKTINGSTVGHGLIYSPAKDMDIGLEVLYIRAESKGGTNPTSDSNLNTRLRIQRNF